MKNFVRIVRMALESQLGEVRDWPASLAGEPEAELQAHALPFTQAIQAGDQARIRELIETKLAPHFDIDRMTALAAGRAYRSATPEQKKQLAEQFRTLLIRTYSTALNQYRDQTIDYKPLRAEPGATDVTVRTEVIRPGQAPVPMDYSLTKTPEGWRVVVGEQVTTWYEIKVER